MSTNDKTSSAPTKTRMTGAEVLVECLVREGVDVVFAYPGGASMPIHQALSHQPKIRTILPRHEQGGAFGAEGYGRVTGKVGVCISTSGPGATNMITSIADAYLDSTPLVAITAQVMRSLIGRGAFQETDVFGMTAPIVKHSYLVTEPEELPRIIKEAFYIASTGRPGPVLIDMPKDVQEAVFTPDFDMEMDIPGYNPVLPVPADKLEELGQRYIVKLEELKQSTEVLDELQKHLDEKLNTTEENVHKECVKVYRNVQAAVVEENEKQTETIVKKVKSCLGGRLNGVLGVSIAAVVLTVADIVLHVLSILHIF